MIFSSLLSGRRRLLLAFLRDRWRAVLWAFLLDFLANLCLVVLSLLLAQAVAVLFGFRSVRGSLLGLQALSEAQLLLGFGAVAATKLALDVARLRLRGRLTEDFAHHLRLLAFGQHLRTDLRHHESRDAGRSLLRFGGDLGSVQRLLARGVLQCAADLGLLLLGFCLLAWLNVFLAAAVAAAVLLAGGLGQVLNSRLRRVEERRRGKKSGLLAAVSTALSHLASIQAMNRTTRTEQDFERKARRVRDWGYRYHRLAAVQEALPLFFAQAMLLAVLCFGWRLGLSGTSLFAAVLVLMTWRSPLSRLLRVGLVWEKGLLSLEKIEALLGSPTAAEGGVILKKKGAAHTLRLHDVMLDFGGKNVLRPLSLHLETGQTLRLELPTGGGKTVLAKLLAGLYRPTSGRIEWDGLPAENLSAHSLRRMVAFVSDAFPLTGRSLLDALSPSGQANALAETERQFREFQNLFPSVLQGIDFQQKIVGRTPLLSTGQLRLLQCLRAVLADKPFLILDDPLAGLDADTADRLRIFLEKNSTGRGVLWLAAEVG